MKGEQEMTILYSSAALVFFFDSSSSSLLASRNGKGFDTLLKHYCLQVPLLGSTPKMGTVCIVYYCIYTVLSRPKSVVRKDRALYMVRRRTCFFTWCSFLANISRLHPAFYIFAGGISVFGQHFFVFGRY